MKKFLTIVGGIVLAAGAIVGTVYAVLYFINKKEECDDNCCIIDDDDSCDYSIDDCDEDAGEEKEDCCNCEDEA